MSDYREESEKVKQIKRGVTEQREKVISKRRKKRFKLTTVWSTKLFKSMGRITLGNYSSLKAVREARQRHETKDYFSDFQIEEI